VYNECIAKEAEDMQVRHNITIDAEVSKELEDLARELGEKKINLIEKALTVYFDLLDLQVARKRLKDLEKGKAKLIDAEDVWKDLGI
jgi:predicted DNA-binding protein